MKWLRSSLAFRGGLLLLAVLLSVLLWLWGYSHTQARRAVAALTALTREREKLARELPALREENTGAIVQALAEGEQVSAEWARELRDPASLPPVATSLEVFFELAAFAERTRGLAARAHVTVQPDERFGFASLANEGPVADQARVVLRQCIRIQILLEQLIAAQPQAVLGVQRERPGSIGQPSLRPTAALAGSATPGAIPEPSIDLFVPDARLLARVPGLLAGEAYRLEFTGETRVLRTFLDGIAQRDFPVLVRSVEVEPVQATDPAPPLPGKVVGRAPQPKVGRTLSRFLVVVEWLELLNPPGKSAS
ncbi:MAG: Amuc_1100 family pilus-like protein [Opitutae bacterium]